MKKYRLFCIIFCITSVIIFPTLMLIVPGFPFFPKEVYRTNAEISSTSLKRGEYTVLYFIEGKQNLSVSRGDVGQIDLFEVSPNGSQEPLNAISENYYFDDAPDNYGIRGHAVCSFYIPTDQKIEIKSHFGQFGYSGFIIRTGLKLMIVSFMLYEGFVLTLSLVLTWFIAKSTSRPNN
jgi:hypothetical protein